MFSPYKSNACSDTQRQRNTVKKADHSNTMHISWQDNGISRMRTDREKSRYTVNKVPLTKSRFRLRAPLGSRNKGRYSFIHLVSVNAHIFCLISSGSIFYFDSFSLVSKGVWHGELEQICSQLRIKYLRCDHSTVFCWYRHCRYLCLDVKYNQK